ncbi:MAG: YgiQ family radical SAM protein, partial [Campylobacterota bacterium]
MNTRFLPATPEEKKRLGIERFDVILVTGDAYIDSPYIGIAVIGRLLEDAGYSVGIIAQPNLQNDDITRLGEPRLFWGVSGGSVDSMVANYTANKKFRNDDDYTPGGKNTKRPDRAVMAYTNLIRRHYKETAPIVLGGIEASLRRVTHYDFWSNKLRRPILFDAKADIILYGMAEKSVLQLAKTLQEGGDYRNIRGLCYSSKEVPKDYVRLPSFEACKKDKHAFIDMFDTFYQNNDPLTAAGLAQQIDTRYLIQNPPQHHLSTRELDNVYALPYQRDAHPMHKGKIKALDTIKFSITTHQGCWGECNFCAIGVHQGRTIRQRSQESILQEAKSFTKDSRFKGIISDVGGATANMYGYECDKKLTKGT